MKIYVAGKFERRDEIRELQKKLTNRGHEISFDWTLHKKIRPFEENLELAREYAREDIEGVRKADVFILLTHDKKATGMHIELGTAILSNILFGKPRIFVIGDHISDSMFYFHDIVNRRRTIQEVLDEL